MDQKTEIPESVMNSGVTMSSYLDNVRLEQSND
jgi:hypothetical protein